MKNFEDLILSKEFAAYMNGLDKENEDFRQNFIKENADLEKEFDNACLLYKALTNHKKHAIDDKTKNKAVDTLVKRLNLYENNKNSKPIDLPWRWIGIAAAIILFICISVPAILYITEKSDTKLSYNEITVPSGEKSSLRLSDGTIIWLNSESKLKYPAEFKKGKRQVILEGEGYFEVAKMKGSTFTVISQDIKVVAMGTKFNVKSYPSEKYIETTLVEGSVKLQQTGKKPSFNDIVLFPDERVVYRKETQVTEIYETNNSNSAEKNSEETILPENKKYHQSISINKVNTSNITCWKDHLLIFDNETFEEIALKMSRWYKIHVNIDDQKLKNHRFTGKFINNETFYQVLEAINLTTPIEYKIIDDQVNIKGNYKNNLL